MSHNFAITTLQARTIMARVKGYNLTTFSIGSLEHAARDIVDTLNKEKPSVFPAEHEKVFFAFALSALLRKAYDDGIINLYNYISLYATIKQRNAEILNDKGAFGDLYEILIRIAIINNLHLIQPSMLSVAQYGRIDIVSKKYGNLEIGQNGKTWTQGTIDDYMEGGFDAVIYGVFSEFDKALIYDYCANEKIEQAIKEVKKRSAYWSDKYQFENDYNHLGHKGKVIKGVTIKSGKVMTQFTEQMYYNFIDKIANKTFIGLETLL